MYEELALREYQEEKSGIGDIPEIAISQAKRRVTCTV